MIDFEFEAPASQTKTRIKVIGVGGAGGNTVNAMLDQAYEGVTFIVANTDAQALGTSRAAHKLQIGTKSTKGLGSGANPEMGKKAAEEDLNKIMELLEDAEIVFLTGGLGGGTGSGAIPVIANALKERNILSIAVVTKPFSFEGKRRSVVALQSEELLKKSVDTLIVIPNQNLLTASDKNVSLVNAFGLVNTTIGQFVKSIADIINKPGHINVDLADIKAIMKGMGRAVMGTGRARGDHRAEDAAFAAIASSLLEDINIKGARSVLLNVTGSSQLGLLEVSAAASLIAKEAHEDASIILGSVIDESMGDEVSVTVIATGFVECVDTPAPTKIAPAHIATEPVFEVKIATTPQQVASPEAAPVMSIKKEALENLMSKIAAVSAPTESHVQVTAEEPQQSPSLSVAATEHAEAKQDDLEVPTLLRKMIQEKKQQQKN